jgi:general secretion pathway protein C
MTFDLQKSLNGLLLLLTVSLGLLVGGFAADWLGILLAPQDATTAAVASESLPVTRPRLEDFTSVTQRNLFDSQAKPETLAEPSAAAAGAQPAQSAAAVRVDLALLGTVAGGEQPLAVIAADKEVEVYRLGARLPGNLILVRIERDRVVAESADGRQTVLELSLEGLPEGTAAGRPAPAVRNGTTGVQIIELGENSWQIPREEAEKARSNLNALLKTARMVPKIENGTTVGFTIVNIQPGTFLDLLGLKAGDVLVQINQVELNSPEKALQIFQQVREANNISLGLLRNGSRQTFEYTID